MRRRRAQRCILRAGVALEAGFVDDARAALEEARLLNAPAEEIARIERSIAEADTPAPPVRRRMGWGPVGVAAATVMAVSAFGLGTLRRQTPATVPTAQMAAARAQPDAPSDTVQNVPVRIADVLAVPTTGLAPEPTAPDRSDAAEDSPAEPVAEPAAVAPESTDTQTSSRVPPPQPIALTATSGLPAPPRTTIAPPVPPPAASDAPAGTATAASRVTPSVPPVAALNTAPAAAPPRDESSDVRAVLARYETAYTQLDSSLARAVWPSVDERALARAFSGLESQTVSLDRCDVALNGATARATCAGTSTWTPKVGGGSRTEARRWTFELAKSGDGWRIERAVVR